ncbi:zinc ribbon domain-containing protein [Marasmitruncus massiliensis]|uniref:zinc ribbon domain-containing protein n=1 Tax=Marasmitruncus massiliensis TaxID=1944642 RepID=UPI000C7C8F06|nr:zinc ribbon domain-containing protein [Marasmitruncus massiliensis]
MICRECKQELPEGSTFCRFCGAAQGGPENPSEVKGQAPVPPISNPTGPVHKPPRKKRGCLFAILITVAVLFGLGIVSSMISLMMSPSVMDSYFKEESSSNLASSSSAPVNSKEESSSEAPASSEAGITPSEFYGQLQDNDDLPYQISEKAQTFLETHPDLFPVASEQELSGFVDRSIEFKHLEKNSDKYGDQLMYLPEVYVIQIKETQVDENLTVNEINLIDVNGLSYYVFYMGALDDIFKDDVISVWGLPLGMSQYENTGGGTTITPVLAGSYLTKIE